MAYALKMIALTGGIATGKSTVAGVFSKCGAQVVDADRLAREVVVPGQPGWHAIVARFGDSVLSADGTIDRKALGARVFTDHRQRLALNDIVHPLVFEAMAQRVSELRQDRFAGLVALDIPLFFETGCANRIRPVVLVYADPVQQQRRLMKRDGISASAALDRIRSQMPIGEKRRQADFVIDNSGSIADTEIQSEILYRQLAVVPEEISQPVVFYCNLFDDALSLST